MKTTSDLHKVVQSHSRKRTLHCFLLLWVAASLLFLPQPLFLSLTHTDMVLFSRFSLAPIVSLHRGNDCETVWSEWSRHEGVNTNEARKLNAYPCPFILLYCCSTLANPNTLILTDMHIRVADTLVYTHKRTQQWSGEFISGQFLEEMNREKTHFWCWCLFLK